MTLVEFLDMGGYAFYVWSSYGIAFVALVINLVEPIMYRQQLIAKFARRQQRVGRHSQ